MFNTFAHYAVGAITGAIARRAPVLAGILAGGFFLYQVIEMIRKYQINKASKDYAYPEIRQFLLGFGLGATAEVADAVVCRGGIDSRLYAWRGHWLGACRSARRAALTATNKLTGKPAAVPPRMITCHVNGKIVNFAAMHERDYAHVSHVQFVALATEQGARIPEYHELRRYTTGVSGAFERILASSFRVYHQDVFVTPEAQMRQGPTRDTGDR